MFEFMRELATAATSPGSVFFTGGATALLLGFREQTLDVDIRLDPEPAGVFETIAHLKNRLDINVELASPADFIPAPADWRERCILIKQIGQVAFFHYDFVLQALAKIERGHEQDLRDVADFLRGGHVTAAQLRKTFIRIQPGLTRYPAIDPVEFQYKVESVLNQYERS